MANIPEAKNKLSGAWEKTSKFGKFYSTPNISKADVLALMSNIEGDTVQVILQPVTQGLSENSPQFNVKLVAGYVKQG